MLGYDNQHFVFLFDCTVRLDQIIECVDIHILSRSLTVTPEVRFKRVAGPVGLASRWLRWWCGVGGDNCGGCNCVSGAAALANGYDSALRQ